MFTCPSTELQFLVYCINEQNETFDDVLLENLNWRSMKDMASQHRLIPLVCKQFQSMPDTGIPADIKAEFEQKNIANSARNAFLSFELIMILDTLKQAGIPAIPFKGPVLAVSAYDNIGLRQFDDLDILIKKEDIIKAAKLMIDKEYQPFIEMTETIRKKHINAGWGFSLKSPGLDYHLELSSNVLPDLYSFELSDEMLWSNTIKIQFDGHEINTLSPEINLLLLCIHGTKHLWDRLAWVADITYLLNTNPDINWNLILDTATKSGSRRMLFLGLNIARELTDCEMPRNIAGIIDIDSTVADLTDKILKSYISPSETDSMKEEIKFHLHARERLCDRLRYLLSIIFAPGYSDLNFVILPRSLYVLYYIIRPFRLLWTQIKSNNQLGNLPE